MPAQRTTGPSLSILVLILIGVIVGAATGMVLEGIGLGGRIVALASGILAVLLASIARFKFLSAISHEQSGENRMPGAMIVFGAVSAIAGSLAAHDIYSALDARLPVFLGAAAGLLSASIMAIVMETYHENKVPRAG